MIIDTSPGRAVQAGAFAHGSSQVKPLFQEAFNEDLLCPRPWQTWVWDGDGVMWALLLGNPQLCLSHETLSDCVQSPVRGVCRRQDDGGMCVPRGPLRTCAEGRLGVINWGQPRTA